MAITSANGSNNDVLQIATSTSGQSSNTIAMQSNYAPASGTDAGQIDLVFHPANPSATTSATVYTLTGGGLLHADGVTAFNLAKLTRLRLIGLATSGAATLTVGGGTNPVIPAITIDAAGGEIDIKSLLNSIAITSGSNHKLTITASASSVPYELRVDGRSA